jgi:hypothetical protein
MRKREKTEHNQVRSSAHQTNRVPGYPGSFEKILSITWVVKIQVLFLLIEVISIYNNKSKSLIGSQMHVLTRIAALTKYQRLFTTKNLTTLILQIFLHEQIHNLRSEERVFVR